MADVFISYSRSDKEFVLKLRNALEASNHVTWLDLKDIPYTAEWRAEIYANIEAANNFLCVLSPNFITSPNCRDELAHAVECKKRLVPIVRRDVDFDAVPPDLAKMQSIPFQEWRDFNDALKKLIDALDTDLDYVRMSTRLLVRAHEWESKARNPSFTLRGKDLEDSVLWLAEGATKKPSPTALHTEYISASKRNVMIRRRYLFSISGLVSVVLVVALVASVVFQLRLQRSLPANVTTLSDNGPGSLRQAIASAKPGSTITFADGLTGTIKLNTGLLFIDKNLVISGPGPSMLSVSGGYNAAVFDVAANVTISGLTIRDGKSTIQNTKGSIPVSTLGSGINNEGTLTLQNSIITSNSNVGDGGGIVNRGTLTLQNSKVFGNMSSANNDSQYPLSGDGGGISNVGTLSLINSTVFDNRSDGNGGGISSRGMLTLRDSTVSGNRSNGNGGGIDNAGTLTLSSSTVSGNKSGREGGGIYNHTSSTSSLDTSTVSGNTSMDDGGGIFHYKSGKLNLFEDTISGNTAMTGNGGGIVISIGQANIIYCTVYGNTAVVGNGGGIGIYDDGTNQVTMSDSIVAGDHANTGPDVLGTLKLQAHNLIQSVSGATFFEYLLVAKNTITGIPPDLGPLQNNGGSTQTHALLAGSPAIDQEPCEIAFSFPDQRGVQRPQGNACDLGSYEYQAH